MAIPWESSGNDPLHAVSSALSEGDFELAARLLRNIDRTRLDSQDKGRTTALDIVVASVHYGQTPGEAMGPSPMDVVTAAMEENREDKYFLLALAIQLSERGDYEYATKVLRQLCEDYGDEALPWYNLGLVFERDDDLERAAEAYAKATNRDPSFLPARLNRALCLQRLQRLAEAADEFERYLSAEPSDAFHWVSLGIVRSDMSDEAGAIVAYDRALQIDPASTTAWFNRGVTAARNHNRAILTECCTAIRGHAPTDWRTSALEAYLAEEEARVMDSWRHWTRAIDVAAEVDNAVFADTARRFGSDDYNPAELMAVDSALHFATRHNLRKQQDVLIERMFAHRLFTPQLLTTVLQATSTTSPRARAYRVIIESRLRDPSIFAAPDVSVAGEVVCLRVYNVAADTEAQAAEFALSFDRRIGDARNHLVEKAELIPDDSPSDSLLGVVWVSGSHLAPADSE